MACIWDFDKTLIEGYMQNAIFETYGVDAKRFWTEVNALPAWYRKRGVGVSEDLMHLNHLLTYVKNGPLRGLNNRILRECGSRLRLCPGLPEFMDTLKRLVHDNEIYRRYNVELEHYVISGGLAEMIRGSPIASFVDGIFGCEFLEDPLLPRFDEQCELPLGREREIDQIGRIVDNTIKTRFLFEINKGSNKNPAIDVNASVQSSDRRIPMQNMIYIADGPTDVPMFAVIRERGGKAFAVHTPDSDGEFLQNDELLRSGRIDCYGPADYRPGTPTYRWISMHVGKIADRIVAENERELQSRIGPPPAHRHDSQISEICVQTILLENDARDEG
jgi:hypothetical protein